MRIINDFEYEEDGIVIIFTGSPEGKDAFNEKYSFHVKDNPNLTLQLLLCIKEHEVAFKGIFFCAHELFRILRRRDLTPLPTPSEKIAWYKQFRATYHQAPVFTQVVTSTLPKEVCVTLVNFEARASGTARNPQIAKALALKEHFVAQIEPKLHAYSE